MTLEKMVDSKEDKKEREMWEKTKKAIENGSWYKTPTVHLVGAYVLLTRGVITREELLDSVKKGAEYWGSEEFMGDDGLGKLGLKVRSKKAEELIAEINAGTIKEINGYKIPKKGDIMLKEGARYIGFCAQDRMDQYFPKPPIKRDTPLTEISIPSGPDLKKWEKELAEKHEGLHLFPKLGGKSTCVRRSAF